MLQNRFYRYLIGALTCACVSFSSIFTAYAGVEEDAVLQLSDAFSNKQNGYSTLYGNYSTLNEAEDAMSDTMKMLDAPSYFNETNLYVQNSIVMNGSAYAIYSEIKEYRDIDDVDWKTLVSTFKIDKLTKLQKMIWVHEWLCDKLTYDLGKNRTLSECLSSGKAKCDEYSMLYAGILNELGIECRCVDGLVNDTASGHMWNLVMVGNQWYFCDLTADDETDSYDNFLRGAADDVFLMDHSKYMKGSRLCNGIADFSGYPISKKNYFYYTDTSFDRTYDLADLPDVSKRAANKASFSQIHLFGRAYTKNGSKIKTRNIPGVMCGTVRDADGVLRKYLVQVYD